MSNLMRYFRALSGAGLLISPIVTLVGWVLFVLDLANVGVPIAGIGLMAFFLSGVGIFHFQQNEIDALKQRVRSLEAGFATLEVTWRPESPFIGNEDYYRIGVKNHGPATAKSVAVKLERIEPTPLRENDRILPSRIGEKGGHCQKGNSACDINVGDEHYFDLFRGLRLGGIKKLFLGLQTIERPDAPIMLADHQEYVLVFLVTAANGSATVPARLSVTQDNDLALSFRLLVPDTEATLSQPAS